MEKRHNIKIELLPISPGRTQDYLRWFNDREVRRFLEPTTPKTEEEITQWLKEITNSREDSYFSIFLPQQNKFIGHVGLKNIDLTGKQTEIGVVIGEKVFWRKGLGTKAVSEILKHAKRLGLQKVFAQVQEKNFPSHKLFTTLGFEATKIPHKQSEGFLYWRNL